MRRRSALSLATAACKLYFGTNDSKNRTLQDLPMKRPFPTRLTVDLDVPDAMVAAVAAVMQGEYESGYSGHGLVVLDVGANVGAFCLWASMRWPGSTIHAYEPNPGTFETLRRNVSHLPAVVLTNAAVYPHEGGRLPFCSRYVGDGEAGLRSVMERTFRHILDTQTFNVDVLHPRDLPPADVIKLDVEGCEGEILEHVDLSGVSLILAEYQTVECRDRMVARAGSSFALVYEDSYPWDLLLPDSNYRPELAGNECGHVFLARRNTERMHRAGPPKNLG